MSIVSPNRLYPSPVPPFSRPFVWCGRQWAKLILDRDSTSDNKDPSQLTRICKIFARTIACLLLILPTALAKIVELGGLCFSRSRFLTPYTLEITPSLRGQMRRLGISRNETSDADVERRLQDVNHNGFIFAQERVRSLNYCFTQDALERHREEVAIRHIELSFGVSGKAGNWPVPLPVYESDLIHFIFGNEQTEQKRHEIEDFLIYVDRIELFISRNLDKMEIKLN